MLTSKDCYDREVFKAATLRVNSIGDLLAQVPTEVQNGGKARPDPMTVCHRKVTEEVILLETEISSVGIVVTVLEYEMSTWEALGLVGGNLGLICGFCVLGGLEMLYWIIYEV